MLGNCLSITELSLTLSPIATENDVKRKIKIDLIFMKFVQRKGFWELLSRKAENRHQLSRR